MKQKKSQNQYLAFQPQYQRLAQSLMDEILRRELKEGDFFDTLNHLVECYKFSIRTVRNTIALLVQQGILQVVSAKGIYIRSLNALYTSRSLKNVILYPFIGQTKRSAFFDQRSNALMKVFCEQGYLVRFIQSKLLNSQSFLALQGVLRGVILGADTIHLADQFNLRKHQIPLLCLHGNTGVSLPKNRLEILFDDKKLAECSLQFFLQKNKFCQSIVIIRAKDENQEAMEHFLLLAQKAGISVKCHLLQDHTVKEGERMACRLSKTDLQSSFWIWDDFPALGFFMGMMKRGIDLRTDQRILVYASPYLKMTEEMGIPVIGYSPVTTGQNAAEHFCRKLQRNNDKSLKIQIAPEYNQPADISLS